MRSYKDPRDSTGSLVVESKKGFSTGCCALSERRPLFRLTVPLHILERGRYISLYRREVSSTFIWIVVKLKNLMIKIKLVSIGTTNKGEEFIFYYHSFYDTPPTTIRVVCLPIYELTFNSSTSFKNKTFTISIVRLNYRKLELYKLKDLI